MELSFLTQKGYLPTDVSRGVLRSVPLEVQSATSTGLLNHLYDVLGGLHYVAQNTQQESRVGLTEEEIRAAESVFSQSTANPEETVQSPLLATSSASTTFSHVPQFGPATALFRSEADVHYLTNTIGLLFAFPLTENSFGLINRAVDMYGLFLHAGFAKEMFGRFIHEPIESHSVLMCKQQEALFLGLIEHLSLLLGSRPPVADARNSNEAKSHERHADAVCRGVEVMSRSFASRAHLISPGGFQHLLRVLSGVAGFTLCSPSSPFPPHDSSPGAVAVRYAISSLLFELLVRSNTRDAPTFQLVVNSCCLNIEFVSQWSKLLVALTRSLSMVVTSTEGTSPSAPLLVEWTNVTGKVRDSSIFVGLSSESVSFLWKRLLEVALESRAPTSQLGADGVSQLSPQVQEVISKTLRDVSLLLSTAAIWRASHSSVPSSATHSPPATTPYQHAMNVKVPAPMCSKFVPFGPSTNAIMKSIGSRLFALLGGESGSVVIPSLQGLCFALLRRESAMLLRRGDADVAKWIVMFFDRIAAMREEQSAPIMIETMLHTSPVFLTDIPVPLLALETVGFAASACVFGLFDGHLPPSPVVGHASVVPSTEFISKTTAASVMVSCLSHASVLGMPTGLIPSIFTSLAHAIEVHSKEERSSVLAQYFMSSGLLALYIDNGASFDHAAELLQRLVDICLAPYGTYHRDILLCAITTLGWAPITALSSDLSVSRHILDTLCSVCVQARNVMEQGDLGIEDTSEVYSCATRAIATLVSQHAAIGKALCRDISSSRMILKAAAVGLREVLLPSALMRDAAMRLIAVHQAVVMSPMVQGSCDASSMETEGTYAKRAAHVVTLSFGAYRLVTVIQLKDSQDVVVIQRDPTGRKVFEVSLRNPPSTTSKSDSVAEVTVEQFSIKCEGQGEVPETDLLDFVLKDPYTQWVSQQLAADPKVISAIDDAKARKNERSDAVLSLPPTFVKPPLGPVKDPRSDSSVTARAVLQMLLLSSEATTRHIPLSRECIGQIKGIDLLPTRDRIDVPIVCVVDTEPSEGEALPSGFKDFCGALGWQPAGLDHAVTHQDHTTDVYFFPVVLTTSQMQEIEERSRLVPVPPASQYAAAKDVSSRKRQADAATCAKVRVVWDFTSTGYDWSCARSAHLDAVKGLSPQFTPNRTSSVDIIVRPLTSVGLFSVRVDAPTQIDGYGAISTSIWAAPLMHGVAVPGAVLASLVRSSVVNAFHSRGLETGRTQSPISTRIAALSAFISQHPVLMPHQATTLFD